ncbi:MAG: alginate export family protein [Betaproteobacteria bacterium]
MWLLSAAGAAGQEPPAGAQTIGDVAIFGSWRTRVESWDWFGSSPAGEYVYPAMILRVSAARSLPTFGWYVEMAVPVVIGLPSDATAPAPQGALGLGASYFAANSNRSNAAGLFVKQATAEFKALAGVTGQSLRIGRMELADGAEVTPKQPTLAALKRDRLAQRLIGPFTFAHVGRSFDGVRYVLDTPALNVTAFAARPTRGVFAVNGWGELNVNVFYGAVTGHAGRSGEWSAFGLGYQDRRSGVLKTDNRSVAARSADTSKITIGTFGGHYIDVIDTAAGAIDLLFWGAAQAGSWGALDHRAGAYAVEAGWQPSALAGVSGWIRGGYDYGSGDGDAGDGRHGTFFQVLPTPRVYARFPIFNMMNTGDAFGSVQLHPVPRLALRADLHDVRLASAADLWYQGGGAFEAASFGYAGRPSNGRTGLVTLADLSADLAVNQHLTVSGYFAHASGRGVTDAIYSGDGSARFSYLELVVRF